MATFYTYTPKFYWDGDTIQAGVGKEPPRSTRTAPPTLSEGPPQEYAVYNKKEDTWSVTTEPEPVGVQDEGIPPIKRVSMSDTITVLPKQTRKQLQDIYDGTDWNDPEDADIGYNADLTLSYLMIGKDINVNSSTFDNLMAFMVGHPDLDVTQEHVDILKFETPLETRDL